MFKIKKIALSLIAIIFILSQAACSVNTSNTLLSLFGNHSSDDFSEEMMYDSSFTTGAGGFRQNAMMKSAMVAETAASGDIENGNTTNPRKLIKNVYISAETRNFDDTTASLEKEVENFNGIVDSHSQNNGTKRNNFAKSTHYTIRIPADKLDEFLNTIKGDLNVLNMSDDVADVTDNYQYTLRRQETLIAELDKLTELLKKATNVSDVLTIEERISSINNELHMIENSLKNLDKRIDYSTINLDIKEVKELTDVTTVPTKETMIEGFMSNLRATRDVLISIGVYIVTHAVSILFAIIVILIVVLILRLIRRIIFGPVDMEKAKKNEERKQFRAQKKINDLNNKIALKEAKDKLKEQKKQEELEKEQKKESKKEKVEKIKLVTSKDDDFDIEYQESAWADADNVGANSSNVGEASSFPEEEKVVMDIDDIEDIDSTDAKDNDKNETIEDVFNNKLDDLKEDIEEEVEEKVDKVKKEVKEEVKKEIKKEEKKDEIKVDDKGNKIIDLDFDFG